MASFQKQEGPIFSGNGNIEGQPFIHSTQSTSKGVSAGQIAYSPQVMTYPYSNGVSTAPINQFISPNFNQGGIPISSYPSAGSYTVSSAVPGQFGGQPMMINGFPNGYEAQVLTMDNGIPDSSRKLISASGATETNSVSSGGVNAMESEKETKEAEEKKAPKIGLFQLFRFASKKEKIWIAIAISCSIIQGIALPSFSIVFGELTNDASSSGEDTNSIIDTLKNSIIMLCIGIAVFCLCFVAIMLWNKIAASQILTIKRIYFQALLSKSTTWYDKQKIDELSVKFMENSQSIARVFSEKMHIYFMSTSMAIVGLAIGILIGWSYSLLIYALLPLMAIGIIIFGFVLAKQQAEQEKIYSEAGASSDQSFTFIKTIKSLRGEDHELKKYVDGITQAREGSIRSSIKIGLALGIFFCSVLATYGIAFLIGSRIIKAQWWNDNKSEPYNVGSVLSVFFAVTTGFFAFGNLMPVLKEIEEAKVAMSHVFSVVDDISKESSGGYIPQNFQGKIEFRNVGFYYPSNPDRAIIQNLNFTVLPGQKAGLIGPSGSGKSTVIQLLERFYEPTSGQILIDDIDIKEYDLKFLRNRLGMVQQQPVLFADTIRANLLLGIENPETISDEVLFSCLQRCNAKDFVMKLERGLEEFVGSLGEKLSGGQKQRIAIARVIVRNPSIFLFDEATSALDRRNEAEIQKTIDDVAKDSTSVTIAHRLVTVRQSDLILVLKDGVLLESGSHEVLMANANSYYRSMVDKQYVDKEDSDSEELEDDVPIDLDPALIAGGPIALNRAPSSQYVPELIRNATVSNPNLPHGLAVHGAHTEPEKKKKVNIFEYMTDSKWLLVAAMVVAFINGAIMPLFGMILGFVIGKLGALDFLTRGLDIGTGETIDSVIKDIDSYVIIFCMLAVASFFANALQYGLFSYIGERYTFNLRYHYFRRTLYQDLTYFDQEENTPGAVSGRLSTKCKTVNSLVTTYLGSISQAIASFIVGIVIGMIFSWKLGLVALGLSPLLFLNGLVESKMMAGMNVEEKKSANSILPDTLNNMRLVRSLNAEGSLLNKYVALSEGDSQKILKKMWKSSWLNAISQFGMFFVYAVLFFVGAVFVKYTGDTYLDMMTCMFAVIFGAFGAGMANQFLGNITDARLAANQIIGEIKAPNLIEVDPEFPQRTLTKIGTYIPINTVGEITFRNVYFRFPKFETMVLKHVSFTVEPNKSYALVGPSGSGKSTIMQLLLRFYDPTHGSILLDGVDLREYDLNYLRTTYGIVRQEPTLFNGTIDYNLKYNHPDISADQIMNALQMANAYDFVMNEKDGLSRDVGNRGEKLSGGQKQRIAITRILLRNPKIFLFDEATSALDSQSEEVVQKAMEHVSKGVTSVTIAHRISTIINCDQIVVLQNGRLIEKGSYADLIAKKGVFFELAQIK